MIPKIIHACWLGKNKIPEEFKTYISGWRKLHPDWEIKIWYDEDFEPYYDDSLFVKEALEKKKYGFISDYFRFVVLYKFGGFYIDTDIEIKKPLDDFLDSKMVMGFIYDSLIGTALMGTEPNNPLMLEWLEILKKDYETKKDFTISNNWITKYYLEHYHDFKLNGKKQRLECGIDIYPKDYFERLKISKKSNGGYAEHHCYGSWNSHKVSPIKRFVKKIVPRKIISYIGHKRSLPKTPYYDIYLAHKKEC